MPRPEAEALSSPTSLPRNAPCPYHSGLKYKRCCPRPCCTPSHRLPAPLTGPRPLTPGPSPAPPFLAYNTEPGHLIGEEP